MLGRRDGTLQLPVPNRAQGAPRSTCFSLPVQFITSEHDSYRVQQRGSHILPVAIPQARPAELSSHTAAALVPTHSLGVDGLLPTLVAGVALREEDGI